MQTLDMKQARVLYRRDRGRYLSFRAWARDILGGAFLGPLADRKPVGKLAQILA